MHHKLEALLLDVREGRARKISNHVRRDPKEPGNVGDLKRAQFQKLGVFISDPHFVKLHARFQHQDFPAVRTRLGLLIGLPEHFAGLRILKGSGELNPSARGLGIICKEPPAVVLCRQRRSKAVSGQFDRAQSHEPV